MSRVLNQLIEAVLSFNIYLRHVFIVFSGTTISVLIPVLVVPILTRLYTPEDFGQYGFVYSIGIILGVFCTLRYEHSIVIARNDREAQQAQRLCECLIVGINLFVFIVIAGLQMGHFLFDLGAWWCSWYIIIPLVAASTAAFRVQTLLANRRESYKFVSKIKVLQGLMITFFSVCFGLIGPIPHGMVWAFVLGYAICTVLLQQKNKNNLAIRKKDLLRIAKRYINFPRFSLPAELINNTTVRYPLIIFPFLFGNEVAGFLTLAYRIVAIPARFVSTAVAEVFFQRASKEMREKNQCRHLFLFTSAFLAVISILGFGILYFSLDLVFNIFFESNWEATSTYIKILIPLFAVNFVVSPLSTMIYITEKQTWDLYWQTFYLFMISISTISAWFFYGSLESVLSSLVYAAIISYIIYYILFFILTKEKQIKKRATQQEYASS
ncbi:MAG: lipopolysaccharide biosynthesis protein [Alphaproteobacteria bacterium]|nr:lipopolysaccharide biosynthesis protein [Alphaproteobacteria bacterium]